ncbi:MAG: hypothetical protein GF390_03510 [Candidatus Pacebacteria bacterium]|nr:hypothetical protein [Candidatus Paceibacterota bacterium]
MPKKKSSSKSTAKKTKKTAKRKTSSKASKKSTKAQAKKRRSQKKSSKKQAKKSTNMALAQGLKNLQNQTSSGFKPNKTLWIITGMVVLILLAYLLRGWFVVALVNNKPITRWSVLSRLEKQAGKQTLESIITEELIWQQAQELGIDVSQEELDAELNTLTENLQAQGQDLESLLKLQGMTRQDLEKQIKLQKTIEKILADRVQVTDEEVEQYIEENQEFLPEDQEPEQIKEQVRNQLKQQKAAQEFQNWLQGVKDQAQIRYLFDY